MKSKTQTVAQPKAPAAAAATRGGLLQRKCACGGSAGLTGDCEPCQAKRLLGLQAKLEVGTPGDRFEQEADRVADEVMRGPAHVPAGRANGLQRRAVTPVGPAPSGSCAAPPVVGQVLDSPGRPLDRATRSFMESRFGHDFGRVRVHTDERAAESARAVGARAYTVGRDVVMADGLYAPQTSEGARLLAHELTHVIQQGGAAAAPTQAPAASAYVARQPSPGSTAEAQINALATIDEKILKAMILRAYDILLKLLGGVDAAEAKRLYGRLGPQSKNATAQYLRNNLPKEMQAKVLDTLLKKFSAGAAPAPAPAAPQPGKAKAPDKDKSAEARLNAINAAEAEIKALATIDEKILKAMSLRVYGILVRLVSGVGAAEAKRLYDQRLGPQSKNATALYLRANVPAPVQEEVLSILKEKFDPGAESEAAAEAEEEGAAAEAAPAEEQVPSQVPGAQPPKFGLSAAADAFTGIVPHYAVKMLPGVGWIDPKMNMKRGPYRIVCDLQREADGSSTILYYTAWRIEPGLAGPTNWAEWVIGPDSIEKFLDNIKGYAGAGAGAYMFGPPPPNAVEGARFVHKLLEGEFREAGSAYLDALYESVTDPNWWVSMITASSGLLRGPAAGARLPGGAARLPAAAGPKPPVAPPKLSGPTHAVRGGQTGPIKMARGPSGASRVASRPSAAGRTPAPRGRSDFAWHGGSEAQKVAPAQAPAQQPHLRAVPDLPEPTPVQTPAPQVAPPPVAPVPAPVVPGGPMLNPPLSAGAAGLVILTGPKPTTNLTVTPGSAPAASPAAAPAPAQGPNPNKKPVLCPSGTRGDPIPMVWLKPLWAYKNPVSLEGELYFRNQRKALLEGRRRMIGVTRWPGVGTLLRRVSTPRGPVADEFKEALEQEGFNWSRHSPDHVIDLFFKGRDHFNNLWPLDREVNRLAGTWHPGQGVCYRNPPNNSPRWEAIGSANLVNRWFRIASVGDPPV